MSIRLQARLHEMRCAECRASWGGWLARILFRDERTYWRTPAPSVQDGER